MHGVGTNHGNAWGFIGRGETGSDQGWFGAFALITDFWNLNFEFSTAR